MSVASQPVASTSRVRSWFRAVTTYDVFPDFSAKVRRLFYNPPGVLVMSALAALLCGLFLHPQGFVLFGGISTVIALGIAWPWINLRGLHGSVSFDRARACEGEQVEVCFSLRNRLVWSIWGLAVRGQITEELRERLEELRDALLADNLSEAKDEHLPKVEEAYRRCREAYRSGRDAKSHAQGGSSDNAE